MVLVVLKSKNLIKGNGVYLNKTLYKPFKASCATVHNQPTKSVEEQNNINDCVDSCVAIFLILSTWVSTEALGMKGWLLGTLCRSRLLEGIESTCRVHGEACPLAPEAAPSAPRPDSLSSA